MGAWIGAGRRPLSYFFALATCLAAAAVFFFWVAVFAFPCFCLDCFWFAFGDLSPIMGKSSRLTERVKNTLDAATPHGEIDD
jgi:hypothetical protein